MSEDVDRDAGESADVGVAGPAKSAASPVVHVRRRRLALGLILAVQTAAVVFFIVDAVEDLIEGPMGVHAITEAFVAVALVTGVVLTGRRLRQVMAKVRAQQRAIDTARGDLSRVIDAQFGAWGLTPAERDVGMLALKGLDPAEIASIRGAAPGTVRAQLTRIYAKAGVSGRAQFAAWFVEDLLDRGVRFG
jgi:DNA-binding CsgD family transcriptional regulator